MVLAVPAPPGHARTTQGLDQVKRSYRMVKVVLKRRRRRLEWRYTRGAAVLLKYRIGRSSFVVPIYCGRYCILRQLIVASNTPKYSRHFRFLLGRTLADA